MSNPTPILNNINAFDATKGTTISFNIIGGTDIVRSNIVYIYDLSTNDLICTHLYISTESIHELPPNTDPSIVYASGKSSADFVNNKNYYLQIQTFTNTAGTTGGSGMSVAKTFWCLSNPSLSVNAIPAAISTTSYNVGATYNTNVTDTSIPVTNIIQQYKFDLYAATGTLVQTSGNIIGSGEQEGTSTTYNITYNFSGLVVNSSYYVVVTTTSTEGMTASAQSNTFTVSIETPTVGAATATNNSCDGYISVVSNLSSEYGGNVSGEIASFETDSVNNVSSLKVNMEPIQDLNGHDHPWVGGAGKNKLPMTVDDIKAVNTYHSWSGNSTTINNVTITIETNDSGDVTGIRLNGTASADITFNLATNISIPNGSYKWSNDQIVNVSGLWLSLTSPNIAITLSNEKEKDVTVSNGSIGSAYIYASSGNVFSNIVFKPMIRLASVSDSTYEPYSNICLISGRDSVSANVVGRNLFDGTVENGKWINSYTTGEISSANTSYNVTDYIRVEPNASYYMMETGSSRNIWYDTNKNAIAMTSWDISDSAKVITAPSNARYIRFTVTNAYLDAFGLNYPSTATAYEPYQGQTYTTNLNQTVYGGTLDMATGVLTVDRAMVDLGTMDWGYSAGFFRLTNLTNFKRPINNSIATSALCTAYNALAWNPMSRTDSGAFAISAGGDNPIFCNTNYTDVTAFKESVSGVMLCYELAEPQTYQLTPHQIQTLVGQNNVWSDAGNVEVTFNLPITTLLVKRQDTSDTSGKWLTLYSQPITQASDMDFTYIDFLNQHGKTYRYALVPLLTQQQGDVDVEIEGGYTVSDDVLSVFDGVFIANSNGSQKLKADAEYGELETNQDVGILTTIGGKYPFVVSNSNLNYHSGSISALIVPSDFYTNGDLDRLSIVERREAIEQFLTDKTAKILKDWNGNIWLITFVDNVEVSFVDDYGMGLGTLSAKWVEIGDVNDQTDLQQTGLI